MKIALTLLAGLALSASAFGAVNATSGTAMVRQIGKAFAGETPMDDNSSAGTTYLWSQTPPNPASSIFNESYIGIVRNSWTFRNPVSGGLAQNFTSSAGSSGTTLSASGNVITITFANAGSSSAGLLTGSIKMTLNQYVADTAVLKTELTVKRTTTPVGPAPKYQIYNVVDNKVGGDHASDVLSLITTGLTGTQTGIKATDGVRTVSLIGESVAKYGGAARGTLTGIAYSSGNFSNSLAADADTAMGMQWGDGTVNGSVDLPLNTDVVFTTYILMNTDSITAPILQCNKADITDGSGTGNPDHALTGSDVVVFFQNFFGACTAPAAIPCNKADITDGSGTGNPEGSLTGSDVVTFFQNFFGACTN